ncbi:MAG: A/G-specific adenine glycosylase [Prevotellaceae bacterium]|nr:A/G-specific adenine glycosylase [Prevotellaceae bacterium]
MNTLADKLIAWYRPNKRDLPWRNTKDPYAIWVSEVILQQTRVAQGLAYYHRFLQAFPTVHALAAAPLDDVMRAWQGLGYYTRARNMHAAAQQVVGEHGGAFPNTYEGLRSLRGVGDYTASAIGAFAFGIPRPAVDGNVYRIWSRIFGVATPIDTPAGQKELYQIALDQLDKARPSIFNQAIMDFGGTLCTPKNPRCGECPVCDVCYAFRNSAVAQLPAKSRKVKVTDRYFAYLMVRHKGYTFIRQREGKDIWHSLYEFPLIETAAGVSLAALEKTPEWKEIFGPVKPTVLHASPCLKHALSHQHLHAQFYIMEVKTAPYFLTTHFIKVKTDSMGAYPTPRLIDSYMAAEPVEKYFLLNDAGH